MSQALLTEREGATGQVPNEIGQRSMANGRASVRLLQSGTQARGAR
jgi:hypothetical protein